LAGQLEEKVRTVLKDTLDLLNQQVALLHPSELSQNHLMESAPIKIYERGE
jgi:hypothetical protein